jgi:L-histidine N-alpha-methyltransferase
MAIQRSEACPRRVTPTRRHRLADGFLADALAGLTRTPKELPCKYFYDEEGSRLFDRICELDEYYLTRTELDIMRRHAPAMASALGAGSLVIEYGSGSSTKTPLLLEPLADPAGYVPVDISGEHLTRSAAALAGRFEALEVRPVAADFTQPFAVPVVTRPVTRRVVYFPGSTIGNFAPDAAARLLASIAELVGPGGGLLIGIDLKKSASVLEPAYNDRLGVTAAFNMNLLVRLNRELGADFDLGAFRHYAFYHAPLGRVEMHLVSRREQTVCLGGVKVHFEAGESIHTENSHKYAPDEFAATAAAAGFRLCEAWYDERNFFGVLWLTVG